MAWAGAHCFKNGRISKRRRNLPTNLQALRVLGHVRRNDFKVSAESAFASKEEDYADRKFQLPSSTRSTFLMVFSPNGKLVASTHGDHIIYVSDLATGKCIRQLSGHPRTPWCLAFHPVNNDLLASGCLGGQVRVWDLCGGSEIWCSGGQTVIASIAFHPSSDCLLVIATHNELHFWDWNKKAPFMKIATKHEKERVRYVTFDSTGHKLITGIANRLLYTTPLVDQPTASDDSETEEPTLNLRPSRTQPTHSAISDEPESSTSNSAPHLNIFDGITSRQVDGSNMSRLVQRLISRQENSPRTSQRSMVRSSPFPNPSSAPEAQSTSSSSSSAAPSSSHHAQFSSRDSEVRPRHVLTSRRSSMTPQTRRRVPISPGLLSRTDVNRSLTTQQNRRLFVREFASQLFSMFTSYVQDLSSDSENEAMDAEVVSVPPPHIVRPRSGGVPTLTERYRRFRPLRVGRWNSNIITQSNLIIHSPSDAGESSRQPTRAERGYIFANIHVNHRIQCWTFSEANFPPDITDSSKNVVVSKCKINNDSSVSISSCNKFLAAIIPECQAQDVKISIYSVCMETLGQKLFTHSLARNVVSVSFSPSAHFLLVGFATNRLLAYRRERYPMAQIFRLPFEKQILMQRDPGCLEPVKCVMQQQSELSCTYRGINCMRWAPVSGQGVMYGTNTGELGILY